MREVSINTIRNFLIAIIITTVPIFHYSQCNNGTNFFPTFAAGRHHHQPIRVGVSVLAQRYFCRNRRQPLGERQADQSLCKYADWSLLGIYLFSCGSHDGF